MEIITTTKPEKPAPKPTPTILFIAAAFAVALAAPLAHAETMRTTGINTTAAHNNGDGIAMKASENNDSSAMGSRTGVNATSTGVATSNEKDMNNMAPSAGANSFTEAQATSRISKAGFTNVSTLTKGQDGIWRGTAMKNGTTRNVMLDYKGNVTVQ